MINMKGLKSALKRIPGASAIVQGIRKRQGRDSQPFETSGQYWEERYRAGGNSGAGSYGRLARFKAEILNGFVREHGIRSIVELGCGDGSQLGLAEYPSYVGVDVSQVAVSLCRQKYASDASKRFLASEEAQAEKPRGEAAFSLDVIYHLVEDQVYEHYMRDLFDAATNWVVIYSSNRDEWVQDAHVRHRMFSRWIAEHAPAWKLHEKIAQRYRYEPGKEDETSFADFYIYRRIGA